MPRPAIGLADIFRQHGKAFRAEHRLPREQTRVMRAIETCRTAVLGGHIERCSQCDHVRIAYNSCRNRHCPKCQGSDRLKWLESRQEELLPVEYFHVVFTVPEEIARIAFHNKREVYGILFAATSQTLATIAQDPKHLGAEPGFFAILHTSGQNLLHHPHLHCVVPGGGLSPDRRQWIGCPKGFFLAVRVLSRLFRRLFLEALEKAHRKGKLRFSGDLASLEDTACFLRYLRPLRKAEWVWTQTQSDGGPCPPIRWALFCACGHPSRPSVVRNRRSATSGVTRTASRSQTSASCRPAMAR